MRYILASRAVFISRVLIFLVVDGIDHEDWDEQHVLQEITKLLELGWDVSDKYRKTPIVATSILQ